MYVTRGFERIGNSPSSSRHTIPTASLLAELSMPIARRGEADIEKHLLSRKTAPRSAPQFPTLPF